MQTIVKNIKRVFSTKSQSIIAGSESILGYKVYTALLTQSGTNPPTAIVLQNTLSATPVWGYLGVGTYNITLASEFTVGKTFCLIGGGELNSGNFFNYAFDSTTQPNSLTISFSEVGGGSSNGLLDNTSIEIRVYP